MGTEKNFSLDTKLLGLPLETICHILYYLSPHDTSQFARVSKISAKIFKFDIKRTINLVINEWSVFLFSCPRCGFIYRAGSEVTSTILTKEPFQEQTYRSCRSCYYKIRKETMKMLNSMLIDYRSNRDHPTKFRRMAFIGICRYQTSGKYPRKKDLDFMKNVAKQIYG